MASAPDPLVKKDAQKKGESTDPFSASAIDPFAGSPIETSRSSFNPVLVDPFAAAPDGGKDLFASPGAPAEKSADSTPEQPTSSDNPFEKSSFFPESPPPAGTSQVFDAFDGTGNPFSEFDGTPKDAAGEASQAPPPPVVVESTTAKSSESQTASPGSASSDGTPTSNGGSPTQKRKTKRMSARIQELAKNFGEKVNLSEEEEDASGGNGSSTS